MMSNSEARKRLAEAQRGDEAGNVPCVCSPFIRHPWCRAEHDIAGCGAVNKDNPSWIPCMIVARPHVEHWSWSGCAGGHVTWLDDDVLAARDAEQRRLGAEAVVAAAVRDIRARFGRDSDYDDGLEDALEILHAARAAAQQVSERDKSGHDGHAPQLNGLLADCPGCATPPTEDRA